MINKKGKNVNYCMTEYQNQSEKIESHCNRNINYVRKDLLDTIRKKIKLNSC